MRRIEKQYRIPKVYRTRGRALGKFAPCRRSLHRTGDLRGQVKPSPTGLSARGSPRTSMGWALYGQVDCAPAPQWLMRVEQRERLSISAALSKALPSTLPRLRGKAERLRRISSGRLGGRVVGEVQVFLFGFVLGVAARRLPSRIWFGRSLRRGGPRHLSGRSGRRRFLRLWLRVSRDRFSGRNYGVEHITGARPHRD